MRLRRKRWLGGTDPSRLGSAPEGFELVSGTVEPTLQPALHHHDGVEGAGARTGDRVNGNAPVFEEGVEHTPREGAVRSTTLQGQRHRLLRTRPGQATGLAGMAASAAGLRAVLPDDAVMSRGLGHGGSSNAAGPVAVRADRADRVLGDQGNRTLRVCPRKQLYAGEHVCQRVSFRGRWYRCLGV